jgi:hypothetical protein
MSLFIPSPGVAEDYVGPGDSVPPGRRFLPVAQAVGTVIGAGRIAFGVAFLAAPVMSVRVLGMDTATAKRITHLARMAAARDLALGVGAVAGVRGGAGAGWVLAGAGADAADAVLIASALRSGKARGVAAAGVALGAVAAAAAGVWAATELGRQR